MYIAASNRVVSVVLVVEREEPGKQRSVQRPVYYVSEVLSQSKQNYPHYQKLVYGVYMATKKLKHYFQEHPIKVISDAPLAEIIGNKDAASRVAKWAIQRAWLPPCVVLVINDNPYGLIFALSYIYRFGLYALLDLHVLESRIWEEDYMLIKAKCKLINTEG